MFQNKTDVLLFLLYIGVLIFAEKIFDYHHAYNKRSEIIHMNLITSLNITLLNKIWRSISNIINIFTCSIWSSIILVIKKSNYFYCNKFQAEWNVAKINSNGKCESEIFFFTSVANLTNLCRRFEIT